jgi:hypothetical protein
MKFQFYFYVAIAFFASPVFAESSLSAHLHGHVKLNVAADRKTLFVEVHSPSQSFLGFEQRPQTDQQKKIWTSVKNQWGKKISELFQIDPSFECKVTKAHMDMHFEEEEEHHHHDEANKAHKAESHDEREQHSHQGYEPLTGEHSEIKGEAMFLCNKEIKDLQLIVKLKKHFQNIEEIEVQVLPNSGVPYSKTLKKDKAILDF